MGQALAARSATPKAAANGSSSSGGSSANAGTITANDFLTLLVTEMKNQDPTATTDPNTYINQLVNVNSLQQLIQINQTLTADSTQTAPHSTGGGGAMAAAINPASPAPQLTSAGAEAVKVAPGNLSVPAASQAASRVAQSLSGRARTE
jgi:flagellar basal-body rod modification protein FlgD